MSHSRCLIWTVLLVSAPAPCVSGKLTKETIEFMGQKRSFHLFVPKDLPSGRGVPLLVTLHGSGRDGASLVDQWKDLAEAEKIILAGPSSRDPAYWAAPADGPDFLHDIAERLKKTYPIDPRRIYLFGHSAGAVFGLLTSMWESRYFAAAAVHAGELQGFEAEDCIAAARRKIPMVIFSGTADLAFPIQGVRITRDTLRDAGFPISLVEIPGHDHNYYAISSRINREAWDFLKRYELPAEPYYELGIKRSPAVAKEFLGTWEGTLVAAGQRVPFIFRIANSQSGANAFVSSGQGAEVAVSVIGQLDAKLTLVVMVGVGGEYRAEINKDGTELNGTWSQSGGDFPLTLKKSHAHEKP